nr:unnamed protein product [Callosobruchus analis]
MGTESTLRGDFKAYGLGFANIGVTKVMIMQNFYGSTISLTLARMTSVKRGARESSDVQKVSKDEYHVMNSFELVKEIQEMTIPTNYVLVPLDAISLFTNIPTDLVIEVVTQRWSNIQLHLSLTQFLVLLKYVFSNSYIISNNEFYKQIFGLGIRNCLLPVCAHIITSELQLQCLNKLSFKPISLNIT